MDGFDRYLPPFPDGKNATGCTGGPEFSVPDISEINPSIEVSTPKAPENSGSGHLDTSTPPALDTSEDRDEEDLLIIPAFMDRRAPTKEIPHDEENH